MYRLVNWIAANSTNNQVEYEALITMGAQYVHILGDSQLVIRQLKIVYKSDKFAIVYLTRA